ncbi:MAG TPA: S8 family serine peptidase [Gaiellaceae bacterium]|nr:S8 family serine peptidase [Gaiellaceae bacterium]
MSSGLRTPRFRLLLAAVAAALLAAAGAGAAAAEDGQRGNGRDRPTFVEPSLLRKAHDKPDAQVRVIVQADSATGAEDAVRGVGGEPGRRLGLVQGVAARMSGRRIAKLAERQGLVVTPDLPVGPSSTSLGPTGFSSEQLWPSATGNALLWPSVDVLGSSTMPAIAVLDSGIDATRPDLAGRVVASATFATAAPNSPGDGLGHGTFVAGLAAGGAPGYAGAAPAARLVSVDVLNDAGMGYTSDIIAGIDWVLRHRDQYGIRVVNLSLTGSDNSSFMYDPLDRAVERLWFGGVVVVAAVGNYGTGSEATVAYSPGNDPFVISVGAADLAGTADASDDFAAPWSAYGFTYDGFRKPEVGAPGRYLVAAVPPGATLPLQRPDRVVVPGYMQLSGTSFATAVVSGTVAHVLAAHPEYNPDQVKGALMASSRATSSAPFALGVGEVDAAAAVSGVDPPNPNAALEQYLTTDTSGETVFDATAWSTAAQANANWSSSNWSSSNWSSSNWSSSNWSSSNWSSSNWSSSNWSSSNWSSSNWSSSNWSSSNWSTASDVN